MTIARFIHDRQERWQRLEELVRTVERRRLGALTHAELKELGRLYRAVTADLAYAQTRHPRSDAARVLNDLAARAHPLVYRSPSLTAAGVLRFLRVELPRVFRRNLSTFLVAAAIFGGAAALGAAASLLHEEAAGIVLDPQTIDAIHRGEMWTERIFGVLPGSVASTLILTNNITVSLTTFAFGLSFGIGTCYLLALNGLMLGAVFSLCWQYGLLGRLLAFVGAHGALEISVVLVAGTGGLLLGRALLQPGDYSRRDALTLRGADAAKLVLGTAPLLVPAGLIEGYLSPLAAVPAAAKMAFGIALAALFHLHLLRGGRGGAAEPARPRV